MLFMCLVLVASVCWLFMYPVRWCGSWMQPHHVHLAVLLPSALPVLTAYVADTRRDYVPHALVFQLRLYRRAYSALALGLYLRVPSEAHGCASCAIRCCH